MEIVIALISLVGSILSIILFFKLWKACNDIKTIAESTKPTSSNIGGFILAGYKEEASKALKLDYAKKLRYTYLTDGDIQSLMDEYMPIFDELGTELPEHLKNASAFNQYYGKYSKLEYM